MKIFIVNLFFFFQQFFIVGNFEYRYMTDSRHFRQQPVFNKKSSNYSMELDCKVASYLVVILNHCVLHIKYYNIIFNIVITYNNQISLSNGTFAHLAAAVLFV